MRPVLTTNLAAIELIETSTKMKYTLINHLQIRTSVGNDELPPSDLTARYVNLDQAETEMDITWAIVSNSK